MNSDLHEPSHAGPATGETVEPGGAAAGMSFRSLLALMREDWETHDRHLSRGGLQAVLVQRFGAWRLGLPPGVPRKAASLVYRLLNARLQNVYGICLYDTTRLGRRIEIAHHSGVVIGAAAVIGDGCLIRQNVTIGIADWGEKGSPRLGRDVEVGAGAVIVGGVTIGDGARIGPNAVVVSDVPAGATAFAAPARRMQRPVADANPPTETPPRGG